MQLIHEFTLRATLKPPLEIGAVPIGTRSYFEIEGGEDAKEEEKKEEEEEEEAQKKGYKGI